LLASILNYVWVLIIAYGGWEAYGLYETYQESLVGLDSQIPVITNKIKKSQKQKKQIRAYLRDIEEAKNNIELVAKEVESLQKRLPESIKDTENLGLIKQIAESLNIRNIFLSPGIEENKGFYFTKRYEFTATGTYLQFLIFFEKVGASERLLNVKTIDIKKSDSRQRGRFQLINAKVIIEAYRYNPDHKEDRGINKIETNFKNKSKAMLKEKASTKGKKS
jgi:Tfp pilus assembly protein PilO